MNDRIDLLEAIANGGRTDSRTAKRGKLRFLIGLPRSGKSTWATDWVRKRPDETAFPRVVVCADDIRLAVTGQRFNHCAEPVVAMIKKYMIESLLARGHDVLVDETNTTKSSIRRNFEADIDAQWTLINTPADVCKERAVDTNQPDLIPVINRMECQLKALLDEGIPSICENLREEVKK